MERLNEIELLKEELSQRIHNSKDGNDDLIAQWVKLEEERMEITKS